jgi:hypothetical protein
MTATASSLFACVRRFRFGFSHESARQAVNANLPDEHDTLTARLVQALHDVLGFSRQDRRRLWDVAIDLPLEPYYGKNPIMDPENWTTR